MTTSLLRAAPEALMDASKDTDSCHAESSSVHVAGSCVGAGDIEKQVKPEMLLVCTSRCAAESTHLLVVHNPVQRLQNLVLLIHFLHLRLNQRQHTAPAMQSMPWPDLHITLHVSACRRMTQGSLVHECVQTRCCFGLGPLFWVNTSLDADGVSLYGLHTHCALCQSLCHHASASLCRQLLAPVRFNMDLRAPWTRSA